MKNKKNKNIKKRLLKNLGGNFILWMLIIVISVSVLQFLTVNNQKTELSYTEFTNLYNEQIDSIGSLIIEDKLIYGECSPSCISMIDNTEISKFTVILPELTNELVDELILLGIDVKIKQKTLTFFDYLFQFSPWILIIVFWFLIMRKMQGGVGGQSGIFSFAKSKARIISSNKEKILLKMLLVVKKLKLNCKKL